MTNCLELIEYKLISNLYPDVIHFVPSNLNDYMLFIL